VGSPVDEVIRILKNASYVLGATVVATIVSGCGGSSVGKGSSSTGSAVVTGASGPLTNLASIGYIDTIYLSGAGRSAHFSGRDLGDVAANITYATWVDQQGNTVSAPPGAYLNVQADAYSGPQVLETPCTFGPSNTPLVPDTNADSRLFGNYTLEFNYLTTDAVPGLQIPPANTWVLTGGNMAADEQNTGDLVLNPSVPGETGFQGFTPQIYPAYVRAFPGRFAAVTVRIDPNTLGLNFQSFTDSNGNIWGPGNPRGIWETTQFNAINFANQPTPSFNSTLSDYLSFDISHMLTPAGGTAGAQWPTVSASGGTVLGKRVYFSGDTYAISDVTTSGNFYQLTKDISGLNVYLPGTFSTNTNITGLPIPNGQTGFLPGTYALTELNPGVVNVGSAPPILSLEGMFEDVTKMFPSITPVMAITLPSSQDNNIQDMILFKENASGQIVDFYYGYIDFEAFEFYLYPINTLVSAKSTTFHHGTISPGTLFNSVGGVAVGETSVRSGSFKLDSPLTWQDGTNTTFQTGRFIVYRK